MNQEPQEEVRKRAYEISALLEEELGGAPLASLLKTHGAEITFESPARAIRLAYPIRKHTSAFFTFFQFMLAPDKLQELDTALSRHTGIIRYLIVIPPTKQVEKAPRIVPPPEPKPVEQKIGALTNEALEKKLEEILK